MNKVDYIEGADNVYRTKNYIVKQQISSRGNVKTGGDMVINDTYYPRTKERDNVFRCYAGSRICPNGLRIQTKDGLIRKVKFEKK